MKALFDKRRLDFHQQIVKYLPYVFNDHFVLVLLVGLGFGLYQYRELLLHFPSQTGLIDVVLALILMGLLSLGRVATFVKPADQHYLLAKEDDLIRLIKAAQGRAVFVWSLIQILVVLGSYPILSRLGWTWWQVMLLMLILTAARFGLMARQVKAFLPAGQLDWDKVVKSEQARQQGILKFFALFTNVKGLSTSIKPRPYLNAVLKRVPKGQGKLYHHLYWRAFLRSGDYLGLTVRLGLLALLSALFIRQAYLATGLALVFNWLLWFQLLGLYHHYDYQYLLTISPQDPSQKADALLSLIQKLASVLVVLELVAIHHVAALLLLLGNSLLLFWYLPAKIKHL